MPPHPSAAFPDPEIDRAGPDDIDGILALMEANQPERGGSLSARLSRTQLMMMLADLPLLIARRGPRVVAFLLAASKSTVAHVPVIRDMLAAYSGAEDAYVYGPVAVEASERGRGIVQRLFVELKGLLPGREGILFIRADNEASLRAHEKMGVVRRAKFIHQGFEIVVFSYFG